MTPEAFEKLFDKTIEDARKLALLKGGEYAPGKDRLENFKTNAEALALEPITIWAVYAAKHWDAIRTYVKDVQEGKVRERAEGIEGRALDLIVYLTLFLGLVKEWNSACPAAKTPERQIVYPDNRKVDLNPADCPTTPKGYGFGQLVVKNYGYEKSKTE